MLNDVRVICYCFNKEGDDYLIMYFYVYIRVCL